MMKVLLINRTFYPDVAATAQRLTDFALALTKAGHEVTVSTGRNRWQESSDEILSVGAPSVYCE